MGKSALPNAGLDLAVFNNLVRVTFDYNKNIHDLLLNNPLAPSPGFADSKLINVSLKDLTIPAV